MDPGTIDKTVCINIGGFVPHDGLTMGKSVNGYNGQYWGEKSENGHNGRMTLSGWRSEVDTVRPKSKLRAKTIFENGKCGKVRF